MSNSLKIFIVFLFVFSAEDYADSPKNRCTFSDQNKSEEISENISSWSEMLAVYKRYAQCDDGSVAEGFSESVTNILAEHWSAIDQLFESTSSNSKYKKFIIKHIDDSVPNDRLDKIKKLAEKNCTPKAKKLCDEIIVQISSLGYEK